MGRRYPGSLVARVVMRRWAPGGGKPHADSRLPGRFDGVKAWLLRWEGLLVGGVFMGGLSWMVLKTFLTERVDDMGRRAERRLMYASSCAMLQSHLTAIQDSLVFQQALSQAAAAHSDVQQQWQQRHEERTQRTAQQVALWQRRCRRACGTAPLRGADLQQQQQQQGQVVGTGQQPQQSSSWLASPFCRICMRQLRQAEGRLREEQQALALAAGGQQLWQRIQRQAKARVARLQQQYSRQRLLLQAYEQQLRAWQQLPLATQQLAVSFEPPFSSIHSSSSGGSGQPGSSHISIRVLLPAWIPQALDDRDIVLLPAEGGGGSHSSRALKGSGSAAAALSPASEEQDDDDDFEDIELEPTTLVGELAEEALDVLEALLAE